MKTLTNRPGRVHGVARSAGLASKPSNKQKFMNYRDNKLYKISGKSILVNNKCLYRRLGSAGFDIEEDINLIKELTSRSAGPLTFDSLATLILYDFFDCNPDDEVVRRLDMYIDELADVFKDFWVADERCWGEFPFKICGITIKEYLSYVTPMGVIRTFKNG